MININLNIENILDWGSIKASPSHRMCWSHSPLD